MPKLKVADLYYMNVPDWFITGRDSGVTSFSEEEKCYLANEIADYRWMGNYMTQFSTDKIFLDVGAQMGLSTLPIAARGYNVVSVEPVESSLDFLRQNVLENNFQERVKIIPFAAHCEKTELEIFVPFEEDCASLSYAAAQRINVPIRSEKIQTVILDEELPKIVDTDLISFIKIDVQGAEYDVIKGMRNLLSKDVRRVLFIEWDPSYMNNYGYSPSDLKNFLESLNYKLPNPSLQESEYSGDLIFTNSL